MSIRILSSQNEHDVMIPVTQDTAQPFSTLLDDENNSQVFCCQFVSKHHFYTPLSTSCHISFNASNGIGPLYTLTYSP